MNLQQAVEDAARATIAHGGPEARTDPDEVLAAIETALNSGATHDDIAAEMLRQRSK
ncbi:hypothetical protein [[Kitasatospora] papulosa]|uniref:hypothetical protein n=1 Tax=[Kitasatospora] papulosa TaxID=1464011 RepID=UPI00363AE7D5